MYDRAVRQRRGPWAWAAVLVLVGSLTPAQQVQASAVIDFEASVPDAVFQQDYGGGSAPYLEAGFTVDAAPPSPYLIANDPANDPIGNAPDDGSKHMSALPFAVASHPPAGTANAGMAFERADARHFRILGLDASEYSAGFAVPTTLRFVGIQASGVVEQVFTTDGIVDGTGPLADFESVTLGPEFTNLVRFEIYGLTGTGTLEAGAFAVDNVAYELLPEPGTGLLLALATLAQATRRKGDTLAAG